MKCNFFIKQILCCCCIFLISSCSKIYNDDEKPFYQALKNNYEAYSQYKGQNFDWKASRIFRNKAIKIKQGFTVQPESVIFTDKIDEIFSNDITYSELKDMRERMDIILNNDISKKDYPEETANLQFYYDCWIVEEKNYTRYGQIARCKQGFLDALAYLEYKILRLNTQEQDLILESIDPKEEEFVFIRPKKYIVYFDFDSSAINQAGSLVIWDFLKDVQKIKEKYIINIIGHADRVGKKAYNEKLSKQRANTVKHYLVKNGISSDIIRVKWEGKSNPMVITNNNFKEELNRRVDLEIKIID